MVKNREELLQRMIDLSGVGAEAIDTDELLRVIGIDPDSQWFESRNSNLPQERRRLR